jgi:hypothetical protein
LCKKKYYQEAGLVLYRANLYEESLEAFEKASDWKMFLSALSLISNSAQKSNKYLENIIGTHLKLMFISIFCFNFDILTF